MKQLITIVTILLVITNTSIGQTLNSLYCSHNFNGNADRKFVGGFVQSRDYNNSTATTDRFGNAASAYYFNGNNQIITYPSYNLAPVDNDDFTISCWVKLDPSNNAQRVILAQYYNVSCGDTRAFGLFVQADNSLSFGVYEAGTNPNYASISFGSITDTDWHHIVVGYKMISSANLSFISYIDGVAVSSTRNDNIAGTWAGVNGTVARLGIGGLPQIGTGACATNSPFYGKIDDIYFYSKQLNATEVLANYNTPNHTQPRIKYVDKNATGGANAGDSWANAYLNLQDVLSTHAISGDTVFVMEGNYVSGTGYNVVVNNLKIYGGFSATGNTLATRDWANHKTTLDGDAAGNDNYPMTSSNLGTLVDNASEVLTISASLAVIDGFTITGGNGSTVYSIDHGTNSTNITLRNCELKESSNNALASKVGLYVSESNSLNHTFTVENCHFHDLYGRYFVPFHFYLVNNTTMDVFFVNNLVNDNKIVDLGSTGHRAGAGGAFSAMDNTSLNVKIINCTFANNLAQGTNVGSNLSVISANEELGTMANLNIDCYNSIFWGNTSNKSFDFFGSAYEKMSNLTLYNNITADVPNSTYSTSFFTTGGSQTDPLFENAVVKDYALSNASTAINAGSTLGIDVYIPMYDIRKMPRIYGSAIDLGAIENQIITAIDNIQAIESVAIYPNPATTELTINTDKKIDYVRIYSTNGALVKEIQNLNKPTIDVRELQMGLYLLEVSFEGKVGITKFNKNK